MQFIFKFKFVKRKFEFIRHAFCCTFSYFFVKDFLINNSLGHKFNMHVWKPQYIKQFKLCIQPLNQLHTAMWVCTGI